MRVIAVINQKGGVGKTTTAINLSAELAKAGKKVMLIDLDPQGNATSGLGVSINADAQAIDGVLLGEDTLSNITVRITESGFDLVPADGNLAGIEKRLEGTQNKELALRTALHGLVYDIVIIDCPPSLGLLSVNSLLAATEVLIPVQAEYYALEGLTQLLEVIDAVKSRGNPALKIIGLVLTMYDKRTTLATDVEKQLDTHFKEVVFKTRIPRNIRLAEAPSHGLPVNKYDRWSKGSRAYRSLAKEVIERG